MAERITKAQLIENLQSKRAEWDAVLASVPESRMTESGVAGYWSVKDLIAHLTYFERWIADRLHENLHGQIYTPQPIDTMEDDERNEIIYQQNRNRPLAEIRAESRQAFQSLMEGVRAHSEAFLVEPQQFEGVPFPVVIWHLLRGNVYDHYGQHIPSIKNWLNQK